MKDNDGHIGFIRELIRIAFAFGGNKDVFYAKVMEKLNVDSLKENGIVQIEETILDDKLRAALSDQKLSEREYELCCLLRQGFSPKEISVMLGLKNSHSVYVKQSRLNKKLKASASPEFVLVMLIISMIWCIILTLFEVQGF